MVGGITGRAGLRAQDRYGLVILLVMVSYAIASTYGGSDLGQMVMVLVQLITVWLVFTVSEARQAQRVAGGTALVVLALAALLVLGALSVTGAAWAVAVADGPVIVVLVALYALTPVVIVGHLARRPTVDLQTLSGGVAAYLLIGMTYAFLYVTVGEYQSAPFFAEHGDVTTAQYLFFSFTTLTTTGYGDLVPAGNPGQTLAISEAVLGQLFLVTALGKIVANLRPRLRVDETASDT